MNGGNLMIIKKKLFVLHSIKKTVILPIALLSLSMSPLVATGTANVISKSNNEPQSVQEKSAATPDQKKELYLIIQSTRKAIIEKNDAQPGTFKVILHDVPSYATAFTDRPIRKVALITLDQLLSLWKNSDPDGFKKNPPNAAINAYVVNSKTEEHFNFFVQLLDPVYNAEQKTLTYTVKPLEGNQTTIPDSVTLGHVNLFIDDICLNCYWP